MSWRFYPLAEFSDAGLLVKDGKQPFAARFLSPEEAKREQPRLIEKRA
jgi:hypothetical protein